MNADTDELPQPATLDAGPVELQPGIPDLQDVLEASTTSVADAMTTPDQPNSPVSQQISAMYWAAREGEANTTLDSLFLYIAIARGLQEAAVIARGNGNEDWAGSLHATAQEFLSFAVGDVAQLACMARYDMAEAGMPEGLVH